MKDHLVKALHLAAEFPGALCRGFMERSLFEHVETCCLFVGYPRSGHSLIGSLIDAHPEAVLAHELDLLRYAYARFGRLALCHLALENSRAFTRRGRAAKLYSYSVPGQWQGRFERIRVIGDKHGESTSIRLKLTPGVLRRLETTLRAPVKMVHVIRNPYDNIATIEQRIGTIYRGLIGPRDTELDVSIDYYFALSDAVTFAREELGATILDVRHEDFVAAPGPELARICRFLGLEPSEDYLRACGSIVFASPRRTRQNARWTGRTLDAVARGVEQRSHLAGYGFEE